MSSEPQPVPPQPARDAIEVADATTRASQDASLRALQVVEFAMSAPAPRRERTWLHRITIAIDALTVAIHQQIRDNDNSIGLLAEIALSEPQHLQTVVDLVDEQRAIRVAIASMREQLDEHPELPVDTTAIRDRFQQLAHRYRQHFMREAELIHHALGIDITDTRSRPLT